MTRALLLPISYDYSKKKKKKKKKERNRVCVCVPHLVTSSAIASSWA